MAIRIGIPGWRYKPWRGDVYCYFDNDTKVHAPFDALAHSSALQPQTDPGRLRFDRRDLAFAIGGVPGRRVPGSDAVRRDIRML